METGDVELALGQFLDQKWARRLGRVGLSVLFVMIGAIGTYFVTLGQRIDVIEKDRAVRIIANDSNITAIRNDILSVKNDVAQLKVDVGVVKGIVVDMQRQQDVASLNRRD